MGRDLALILTLSVSIALIAGCSQKQDSSDNGSLSGTIIGGDTGGDSAPTVYLDSAKLYIYVANPSFQTVQVYRALSPWVETTVTYNNFGDSYAPESYGSFVASSVGWHTVDISSLVYGWINDSFPNYGIVLDQDISVFPQAIYFARESQFKPYLDISFGDTFSFVQNVFEADADAFIDGSNPDRSDGSSLAIMTGWADNSGLEHKSLLHFDLPVTQPPPTLSSITGHIWFDSNGNGLQESTEIGAPAVVVKLRTCDTGYIAVTETNISGNYAFDSLPSGDYRVFVDLPAGYKITQNDIGLDDNIDSDFDTLFAHTICYSLDEVNNNADADCGLVELVSDEGGCTRSHSYFKNRCGFGPKEDIVSELLPIQLGTGKKALIVDSVQTAYFLLKLHGSGNPWNGIVQLYRQLLTAKLNIKLGADETDIVNQLEEIDTFLGTHDRSDWCKLEKEEKEVVRDWKRLLKAFNSGDIGPGSCDDEDVIDDHEEDTDEGRDKDDDHDDKEDDDKNDDHDEKDD